MTIKFMECIFCGLRLIGQQFRQQAAVLIQQGMYARAKTYRFQWDLSKSKESGTQLKLR